MNVLDKPLVFGSKIEVNYVKTTDKFIFHKLKDGKIVPEATMIISFEEVEMMLNKVKLSCGENK